uniref:Uncharacterized protein n=1 Tax=Romanomermis culicivorax TaxID=13658 RepID=A0A915IYU2_ROMCU
MTQLDLKNDLSGSPTLQQPKQAGNSRKIESMSNTAVEFSNEGKTSNQIIAHEDLCCQFLD